MTFVSLAFKTELKRGNQSLFFQELEDQLQEEENKVNHLNKLKGKLEGEIDEVGEKNLVVKKRRRGRFQIYHRSGSSFYPVVISVDKTICFSLSLLTQVYTMVTGCIMSGMILLWTSSRA